MTRTETSRSLNQKLLCAAAPGRDEEGKEKREEGKSGREKKESESGDFFFSRFLCVSDLVSYCIGSTWTHSDLTRS